ncbi:MAG: hypothetical protein ACRDQX_00600 [Pseudonocardiaceae bacterium]
MSEHPTTAPSTRESHPMGGAPRWGVSSQDWQSHALDAEAVHPVGVHVARCGQRLAAGTTLYSEPPGWMCVACLCRTEREDTVT